MKVQRSYALVCALSGVVGAAGPACSAVKGIAGNMGVPVRSGERVGAIAESSAAQGRKLTPGTYVFTTADGEPRTSFRLGEPITGKLEASAPPAAWYQKYTGDMQKADVGEIGPTLYIDGQRVFTGGRKIYDPDWSTPTELPLVLWSGDDRELPLGQEWSGGEISLEEAFYQEIADKLPDGPHEVRFEVALLIHAARGKPPLATGSFTLVVDDAGRKALARQSKRTPPPPHKSFVAENQRVRALGDDLAQAIGARLFVARSTSIWVVERDVFKQPIRRVINGDFVFEKDAACRWRRAARMCEDHLGGGRYGDLYYCGSGSPFEGKPGQGIFAIPCAAAAKLR